MVQHTVTAHGTAHGHSTRYTVTARIHRNNTVTAHTAHGYRTRFTAHGSQHTVTAHGARGTAHSTVTLSESHQTWHSVMSGMIAACLAKVSRIRTDIEHRSSSGAWYLWRMSQGRVTDESIDGSWLNWERRKRGEIGKERERERWL